MQCDPSTPTIHEIVKIKKKEAVWEKEGEV